MAIALSTPDIERLEVALRDLRAWQTDDVPVQYHPGDLGWQWRFGAAAAAASVRIWSRAGHLLALGVIDETPVLRLALSPQGRVDDELAHRIVDDVARPGRGVLPAGPVAIEARSGGQLAHLLREDGWVDGDSWTPLRRELTRPVSVPDLRVEVVGRDLATDRVVVHRAAFDNSAFTERLWQVMADGPAYANARCLIGYDESGVPVAGVTVWSAGPGRPGLLEPAGVHRDHRGHSYGTQISIAAAAQLQEMGCSSATVCTPTSNAVAVATYASAGFRRLPAVRDLHRSGTGPV